MNFHPDKQLFQVAGAGDRTNDKPLQSQRSTSTCTLHHGGPTREKLSNGVRIG